VVSAFHHERLSIGFHNRGAANPDPTGQGSLHRWVGDGHCARSIFPIPQWRLQRTGTVHGCCCAGNFLLSWSEHLWRKPGPTAGLSFCPNWLAIDLAKASCTRCTRPCASRYNPRDAVTTTNDRDRSSRHQTQLRSAQ